MEGIWEFWKLSQSDLRTEVAKIYLWRHADVGISTKFTARHPFLLCSPVNQLNYVYLMNPHWVFLVTSCVGVFLCCIILKDFAKQKLSFHSWLLRWTFWTELFSWPKPAKLFSTRPVPVPLLFVVSRSSSSLGLASPKNWRLAKRTRSGMCFLNPCGKDIASN